MLWDETHTISAGPGGCIQAWKLDPDIVVIGKSIDHFHCIAVLYFFCIAVLYFHCIAVLYFP